MLGKKFVSGVGLRHGRLRAVNDGELDDLRIQQTRQLHPIARHARKISERGRADDQDRGMFRGNPGEVSRLQQRRAGK